MVEAAFSPKEFISVATPVHVVEGKAPFNELEDRDAKYAYYMARASWEGSKLGWFQRSYESPGLFVLLNLIFNQSAINTKINALSANITEDEWNQFLVFSAAVFNNCGNFKSYGDTKFVPQLPKERFEAIIKSSKNYFDGQFAQIMDEIWGRINREVYFE